MADGGIFVQDGSCPFCAIATGNAPEPERFASRDGLMVFEPLDPFAPGHLLVVPMWHVESIASADDELVSEVMSAARALVRRLGQAIVLTSAGEAATQTIMHWHVHVVPRHDGDGLGGWPWRPKPVGMLDTGPIQVNVTAPPVQPAEPVSRAMLEEAYRRGRQGRPL